MEDLIQRLSVETEIPAQDVERLLVKILAPQVRQLYEAEVAAEERAAELQERKAGWLRRAIARAHLQRWAPL